MSDDIILETEDLTKEFAGFVAVNGVNLRVARGTIHALIGPNGAGKTTCFNLLTKFLQPDRAAASSTRASDITALPPADDRAARHRALVPDLGGISASDRAGERAHRPAAPARHLVRFLALAKRALDAFNDARDGAARPMSGSPTSPISPRSNCPMAASARWRSPPRLALDPEMLLLDEPTAGMAHEDIDRIAALIKRVAAEPHRADGRAQSVGGRRLCPTASPCSRAAASWPKATTTTVSDNPEVREAYHGCRAMLDTAQRRCSRSKALQRLVRRSRTSCTA